MWSVPFNQDFHMNWLGIYIGNRGITFDDFYNNYTLLKYSSKIQIQSYNEGQIHSINLMDDSKTFMVTGVMGDTHSPLIKINFIEIHHRDSIRNETTVMKEPSHTYQSAKAIQYSPPDLKHG